MYLTKRRRLVRWIMWHTYIPIAVWHYERKTSFWCKRGRCHVCKTKLVKDTEYFGFGSSLEYYYCPNEECNG